MRTRKEVEQVYADEWGGELNSVDKAKIELLLDIRDLLTTISK